MHDTDIPARAGRDRGMSRWFPLPAASHIVRLSLAASLALATGLALVAAKPARAQATRPGHTVMGEPSQQVRPTDSPAPISSLSPSGPSNLGPNPEVAAPGSSSGGSGPLNASPFSGGPVGSVGGSLSSDPSITGNHTTSPGQSK